MKRFLVAAVLVAALGTSASAQPPTLPPTPPSGSGLPKPIPDFVPPPPGLIPAPVPPPPTYSGPPGPAIPFFKSTGLVVGGMGYYPYDTGGWLLGGTDGLTRQSGPFTMVFPGGNEAASAPAAPYAPYASSKHRLFPLFHKNK